MVLALRSQPAPFSREPMHFSMFEWFLALAGAGLAYWLFEPVLH